MVYFRKEKLDKEEKKRLEREEKKKQRDKDKQDKRAKRSSTVHMATEGDTQDVVNELESPELTIPEPPEISASTEEASNEPKSKPTLFQLAGSNDKKETQPEEAEKTGKKKEKEKEKEKEDTSAVKSTVKGNDNQLRAKIVDLEQNMKSLNEKNQLLYQAKCQFENEKDDLQVSLIQIHIITQMLCTEKMRDSLLHIVLTEIAFCVGLLTISIGS